MLWRNDIDILDPKNRQLLEDTLKCHIYYNNNKGLDQDGTGEFLVACCNTISIESLRAGSIIHVENGKLANGYSVYELANYTGDYTIDVDPETGFNIIANLPELYGDAYIDVISTHNSDDIKEAHKNSQALVEGTNLVLDKEDFIEDAFNFASGKKAKRFNGDKYHGDISQKYMRKILPITEEEFDSGVIKGRFNLYNDYKTLINSKLFFELSGDTFDYSGGEYHYTPSITAKLGQDSKLRRYILKKYATEIETVELVHGKNNFNFDKKCNSCLGYLVEYYSKYKLLGEEFLMPYLDQAIAEVISLDPDFEYNSTDDATKAKITIRACHLKYIEMMSQCYGDAIKQLIPAVKVSDVIKDNYAEWINTIIDLSSKTVSFIKKHMNYNGKTYPVLECAGIKGLCDFISEDTIIDLKTTNNISKSYLMQVLSYYELSKVRSDLHVNKVIVYDCVSDKYVEINLSDSSNVFDKGENI